MNSICAQRPVVRQAAFSVRQAAFSILLLSLCAGATDARRAWAEASQPPQRAERQADEWVDLLPDGYIDRHWHTEGNWVTEDDGVVRLVPREGERGWDRFDAYLWSNEKFADFEIQFEYQLERGGNSGFYFRVAEKGDPVAQGIEVQIFDSYGKAEDARLTDHDSGGIIPGVPPTSNAAKAPGEWNHFHITVKQDRLSVVLNGEVVNEVDLARPPLDSRPQEGFIGFQDHALPLKLRNIKIRKL